MVDLQKPFTVNVFLDGRIYNPGDTVQGEVELDLRKRMLCDLITAQIYGYTRVFFIPNETVQHTTAHEQKKVLIDEQKNIWGGESRDSKLQKPTLEELIKKSSSLSIQPKKLERKENEPGFDAGRHILDFSFELPKFGLNVSYMDHDCGTRYYIKVQCYNYQQVIASGKAEFPVVCPTPLMDIPEALKPIDYKETVPLKKGGSIGISIVLSHCGFVAAERVPITVKLENHSKHSIKYAHVSIEKRLTAVATYPFPSSIEYASKTSGSGLPIQKIIAGETFEYRPIFYVPALVPSFNVDNFLTLDYYLKFEISFIRKCCSKKHVIKSVEIPIFIGTEPIQHSAMQTNGYCYNKVDGPPLPSKGGAISPTLFDEPPPEYVDKEDSKSIKSEGSDNSCPSYFSSISDDETSLLKEKRKS